MSDVAIFEVAPPLHTRAVEAQLRTAAGGRA